MIVIRCTERLLKGSRITPDAQPPAPVAALLRRQGLPDAWIEARRAELADAVVARTASPRMLSYLNQIVEEIQSDAYGAGSFERLDLDGLEDSFWGRPFSAGRDHFFPEDILRDAVAGAPMPDLTTSRGR